MFVPLEPNVILSFTVAMSSLLPVAASRAVAVIFDLPFPLTIFCEEWIKTDSFFELLVLLEDVYEDEEDEEEEE